MEARFNEGSKVDQDFCHCSYWWKGYDEKEKKVS